MKMKILASVSLMVLTQAAVAVEISGFKDYMFGDPLSKYLNDETYTCSNTEVNMSGDYKCTKINPAKETIAGQKLKWLELRFASDTKKLQHIYMTYLDSNDYPDVLDYSSFIPNETYLIKQKLTEKHGAPADHCGIKGCTDYLWQHTTSKGEASILLNTFQVRFSLIKNPGDEKPSGKY